MNGLLGNQARIGPFAPETHTTGFIYMLPLGGGGLTKPWGASNSYLPCCWGTLSETFAKLSDSIFWESADASTLFVNLFVPATASWRGGAVLRQDSGYPYASKATTAITVVAAGAAPTFTVSVRVPFWATGANSVTLNGSPLAAPAAPGSYLAVARTWADGDVLQVLFPPSLRFEQLNDARPAWQGVGAVFFGGIMLAAVNTSSDRLPLNTSAAGLASALSRSPAAAPAGDYADMVFVSQETECGSATLIPLGDVVFEKYATYLHTVGSAAEVVGYNASGFSVLAGDTDSFETSGGAALIGNGADMNIRSGDPGDHSTASYVQVVRDATHTLTGLNASFQYVAGYGGDGAPGGTVVSLVALAAGPCGGGNGDVVHTFYTSPPLEHFPFDVCNTCYSPPINIYVPPGAVSIDVSAGVQLAFQFADNSRNVQVRLPLATTIYWSS